MKVQHGVTLDLTGKFSPRDLKAFVTRIPDNADLHTEVTVIPKDRPGESDQVRATLTATWTE